jgi:hypothetical protein
MMSTINRRRMLASLGVLSGSGVLGGCGRELPGLTPSVAADEPAPAVSPRARDAAETRCANGRRFAYTPLDPSAVAETAYRVFPRGGCMYAVVGSVVGQLAERVGEPFRSFPVEMMRYGDGGVGGWGSLCGVVNGAAALTGLLHPEKPKETRERLINQMAVWYETTLLPRFSPAEPQWADDVPPSVAGSLLCHISVARWCEVSDRKAFCVEKKERCRRLAADGAARIVEILNREAKSAGGETAPLTPEVASCLECHGRQGQGNAMGKMSCSACHELGPDHP